MKTQIKTQEKVRFTKNQVKKECENLGIDWKNLTTNEIECVISTAEHRVNQGNEPLTLCYRGDTQKHSILYCTVEYFYLNGDFSYYQSNGEDDE
jgi:hypothetical protein